MEQLIHEVFQRIEKKYILTRDQYNCLRSRIAPYMQEDEYGLSTICNLYYDTDSYELIRRSIERPNYKDKLRLRCYGIPEKTSPSFIEIKKKYLGIVYKRRIELPLDQAELFLDMQKQPADISNQQIFEEIKYFMSFYKPKKKIYIAYDRTALIGREDPSLRITFDTNVRSRESDLNLCQGDFGEPYFSKGEAILEIKTATAYPLWLTKILNENSIYPASFSKYGAFYQRRFGKLQFAQK